MEDPSAELNKLFAAPPANELPQDVLGELKSILRLHALSPQELFFKWESYSIKMGAEETRLNLDTARAFKHDIQEGLERESRTKAHIRTTDKRSTAGATPRAKASTDDVFGMIDGLMPSTPRHVAASGTATSAKRRSAFETPASKASKNNVFSSPSEIKPSPRQGDIGGSGATVPFSERPNAGQTIESLNSHLPEAESPVAPSAEPRIKLTANTDLKKFSYRPMAMHLSEASEVLDDRIDEFMALIQTHNKLEDNAFGNPATQSTSEVIAVGRIASDTLEGKPNSASLVLETSRRMGAGLRVPLKVDSLARFEFFPGQIIAVRGVNASGDYFTVHEVLDIPLLPMAASNAEVLDSCNERLRGGADSDESDSAPPLSILVASGPFTAEDNLDFEPLHALCDRASATYADSIVLVGPFLDVEHPLVASGDFDLPDDSRIEPDKATMTDVFRVLIGAPLRRLAENVPNITIIMIPSIRDVISKHVSWPQDSFPKKELGLPKQARIVSNPITLNINESVVGISSQDVLYELRRQEVVGGKPRELNVLARLPRHLVEQRHYFPLFPPVSREAYPKSGLDDDLPIGAMLDTSYLKLGEWLNVRPDILICPSALAPFAKVVESVLVINPGNLSKRRGAGTFAQLAIYPANISDEERAENKPIDHKIFERGRVDIIRI
ncbi:DNA polymerase subunit alpha B [Xylona heveae TC161]|uniref:DNA polymerase alpha subunit B n=1 Tax=Xylona heveae (strain CBS 132557 / TC161) TaxID=1328760 RepID=A0A165JUL2_XYLHT|nr:DNA polymerase subunit alpha B [Xylona heveae TC161]KZF26649.1 DNA polymerase subunit alpha B [Xylona heveae TC161]